MSSTIDDWLATQPKPAKASDPSHSVLAGMAQLKAVLDALPNSRAELEAIVERAEVLVAAVEERLKAEQFVLQSFVAGKDDAAAKIAAAVDRFDSETRSRDAAARERIVGLEAEVAEARRRVEAWLASAEERIAQAAEDDGVRANESRQSILDAERALAADLDRKISEGTALIRSQADLARDELEKALARLREDTDTRFKRIPTMVSAPPAPTKVFQDGVLKGERRGIDFVGATVADNGSDRVTVTITGGGGGVDDTAVHLAGTETITGDKTFSGTVDVTGIATFDDEVFFNGEAGVTAGHDLNVLGDMTIGGELYVGEYSTFAGAVNLPGNPATALEAAPKQYVDAETTARKGEQDWTLPSGAIAQTIRGDGPALTNVAGVYTSGVLNLQAIYLRAGQTVTTITLHSATTAAVSPTHQWASLYSSALAKLGVTEDRTTEAWASNSGKTFTLTSAYPVPTSGLYYVGLTLVASTMISAMGFAQGGTGITAVPSRGLLNGSSTTGLAVPGDAPSTAGALTPVGVRTYIYVS